MHFVFRGQRETRSHLEEHGCCLSYLGQQGGGESCISASPGQNEYYKNNTNISSHYSTHEKNSSLKKKKKKKKSLALQGLTYKNA